MKRIFKRFLVFIILISVNTVVSSQNNSTNKVSTIVIDAGHGGHDPGCLGATNNEKAVCLAISLKLGKLIEKRLPAVNVIYTRTKDVFLELQERAEVANKNNADLFISIHANAASASAYGTETYVLGLHKNEANMAVAKRENSVILLEENYETKYAGFDPSSIDNIIAMTLTQSTFLSQSTLMASKVQTNFERSGRRNRGVKQAGYWVLHATAMPSVLIETGFLTNKEEEKYLTDDKTQDKIAENIYLAFVDYKASLESIEKVTPEENKTQLAIENEKTSVKRDTIQEKVKNASIISSVDNNSPSSKTEKESLPKKEPLDDKPRISNTSKESMDEVMFRVQIKTSHTPLSMEPDNFYGMKKVFEYKDKDGLYKYTVGNAKYASELVFLQRSMKSKGCKGAFIIAMQNNQRISMNKAKSIKAEN